MRERRWVRCNPNRNVKDMRPIGRALYAALLGCLPGLVLGTSIHAQGGVPRVVSEYVTVMEIHENAVLRMPRKRTTIFDVTTRVTIKNTSEETLYAPLTSVINANGAGCGDKKWTQSSAKVLSADLSADWGLAKLAPGESATFSVKLEKRPNTQLTYEIVTYGVVGEAESQPQ
jgi:hypothetical protein